MNKKKAIVLGGTNPHIELINNLKTRGYHTILVDYYENPPAKSFADEHICESTLDKEKVLEIAKKLAVDLVITVAIDHANVTACYVGEKLGLSIPYSYETAVLVTDKVLMKRKMVESGISTSKHISTDNFNDFIGSGLKLPVIVKPADSNTAKGVKKVNSLIEFEKFFSDAKKSSRNGMVIVEEFNKGIEVSIYAFIQEKKANIVMLSQRFSVIDGNEEVIKCFSTLTPPNISVEARKKIQVIADQIAQTFNLKNTPLHFEVIVDGNDVYTIELTPRLGGGLSFRTIKLNTGFDIINAAIDSFLGLKTKLDYHEPQNFYAINILYAKSGRFKSISGFEKLKASNIIEELYAYKTEGMLIETNTSSKSRVGAFIVIAETMNELYQKIEKAIKEIDVCGVNGESLLRKDLHLNENTFLNNMHKSV